MISIYKAKQIIGENVTILPPGTLPIQNALLRVLVQDLFTPIDLPPFPQSSMDGYAFAFDSLTNHVGLKVKHWIAAGDAANYKINSGEAVRIFTGAPIPSGADTVVMQEKTEIKDGLLYIHDPNIVPGANYRKKGSEIKAGSLALPAGTELTPATIGFLASMGIAEVKVVSTPGICIIVTGDELAGIGQDLNHGKVYDSNSYTLAAAFKQAGIEQIVIKHIPDQLDQLTRALQEALDQSEIVVLTGGVSVGDFDFVTKAAHAAGIQTLFHKIKQKPGKPMFCGRRGNKFIFGLPGNPASALTCYYEYIEPALMNMMGRPSAIQIIRAPITAEYKKPAGLAHFLKAHYDGLQVSPLDAQESFRLKSFALANALIVIAEDVTEVAAGDQVEVHVLP